MQPMNTARSMPLGKITASELLASSRATNLLVEIKQKESDGMATKVLARRACSCNHTLSSIIRTLGSAIDSCSSESGKMEMQIEKYSSSIDFGDFSSFLYVTTSTSFCKESLASFWNERPPTMLFSIPYSSSVHCEPPSRRTGEDRCNLRTADPSLAHDASAPANPPAAAASCCLTHRTAGSILSTARRMSNTPAQKQGMSRRT